MTGIVETVARAQNEAAEEFHRQQTTIPHSVLAMRGETLPHMRARAAIRATLEFARGNISEKMTTAGLTGSLLDASEIKESFRAVIGALLSEIEQDGGKKT